MENFMDKLAQKFTAQEMIKANRTAEAQEMQRLRTQVSEYEGILKEIQEQNRAGIQEVAEMRKLATESLGSVRRLANESADQAASAQETKAAEEELSLKMTKLEETLSGNGDNISKLQENIAELFRQSDDYVHKENVKVYRNVQQVVVDELNRQTQELEAKDAALSEQAEKLLDQTRQLVEQGQALSEQAEKTQKRLKGVKPLLILTFLTSCASAILLALLVLGIL